MKRRDSQKRGLSMPELMVAMTILFVVCSFVMSMFVTGMRQTAQATQNDELESLVRTEIGKLTQVPFADLVDSSGPMDAPYEDYNREVSLSGVPGEDPDKVKVVEVTVSHPEYGSRSGRTVRCDIIIDPGKAAWEKFDCASCHSLATAGYAEGIYPLGPIPTADGFDGPRPIPAGPNGLRDYIREAILNPEDYRAYDAAMQNFYIEGEPNPVPGDPPFDPNNVDEFIRKNSMSEAEMDALADYIASFQGP